MNMCWWLVCWRVELTGVCVFCAGAAVCRHCLDCGFEVVGMTRNEHSRTAHALRKAGVRLYHGDVNVLHDIDRVFGASSLSQCAQAVPRLAPGFQGPQFHGHANCTGPRDTVS